jgi:hypothetical protein
MPISSLRVFRGFSVVVYWECDHIFIEQILIHETTRVSSGTVKAIDSSYVSGVETKLDYRTMIPCFSTRLV